MLKYIWLKLNSIFALLMSGAFFWWAITQWLYRNETAEHQTEASTEPADVQFETSSLYTATFFAKSRWNRAKWVVDPDKDDATVTREFIINKDCNWPNLQFPKEMDNDKIPNCCWNLQGISPISWHAHLGNRHAQLRENSTQTCIS